MNPTTQERERNPATLPERRETRRGVFFVLSVIEVPRVVSVHRFLPITITRFLGVLAMIRKKSTVITKQPIHASKASLRASDCPASASACTRKHWVHILEIAPEGLCQADAITVLNAARLLAEIEDAESSIEAQGRDSDSSGRAMQAPWSTRHQACLAQWLKYSKALKLDPSARTNDKAPPEPEIDHHKLLMDSIA